MEGFLADMEERGHGFNIMSFNMKIRLGSHECGHFGPLNSWNSHQPQQLCLMLVNMLTARTHKATSAVSVPRGSSCFSLCRPS